jgi:hypothetical protein
MNITPKVAVIILTINQKEKTLRCLRSLKDDLYNEKMILLFDNGSADKTIEFVKQEFPDVITYYSPKNLGVASGRNAAANLADDLFKPQFFLFLDNDTVVEHDFLDKLLEVIEKNQDIAIVTPKIMSYNKPGIIYGAGGCDVKFWMGRTSHIGHNQKDVGQYNNNKECISSGGCMLVRSNIFLELGGFDKKYDPYGPEDLDFVLRAKEKNYKCMYVFNSTIYHDPESGRSAYQSKYILFYAKEKLKFLKIFNESYAPKIQKFIFIYLILPLLYFKAILKIIFLQKTL